MRVAMYWMCPIWRWNSERDQMRKSKRIERWNWWSIFVCFEEVANSTKSWDAISTLTSIRTGSRDCKRLPMMAMPPPLISCSWLTWWLLVRFFMRVRKPETGFFSSFQSEKEDEGRSSHSPASPPPAPGDRPRSPLTSSFDSAQVSPVSRRGKRTWTPPRQFMTSLTSRVT